MEAFLLVENVALFVVNDAVEDFLIAVVGYTCLVFSR